MTPAEYERIDVAFAAAAAVFGWARASGEEYHERESRDPGIVEGWANAKGEWLFSDDDLTEPMARELIRLAAVLSQYQAS